MNQWVCVACMALASGCAAPAAESQKPGSGGNDAPAEAASATRDPGGLAVRVPLSSQSPTPMVLRTPVPSGTTTAPPSAVRVMLGDWMTLPSAFEAIGRAAGRPVLVHWADLERAGFSKNEQLKTTTPPVSLETALRVVTGNADRGALPVFRTMLETRINDGVMEIATQPYFDRQEQQLVCYDIDGTIRQMRRECAWETDDGRILSRPTEDCVKDITDLMQQEIEPEGWVDQGGDAASVLHTSGRLFINAPARYHAQIRALFSRLPGNPPYRIVPGSPEPPPEEASLEPR